MPSLRADIKIAAPWIARALTNSGYLTDFSPRSLWEIDRFFDEQSENGTAKPGGLLAEDLGRRMFALGAYIGEIVRMSLGGDWAEDDDPENELNAALLLPDGTRCWPVQRAMKRLQNGAEDSIAAWASALGVFIGSPPRSPRPSFFKRWFGRG